MPKNRRIATKFSSNLRFLRRLAGLTQAQLAHDLRLKRNNIAAYEVGIAEPNHRTLLAISQYFSTSLDDFIEKDLSLRVAAVLNSSQMIQSDDRLPVDYSVILKLTSAGQRVLDGILALQEFKREATNGELPKMGADFLQLHYLLEKILEANRVLIKNLHEKLSPE